MRLFRSKPTLLFSLAALTAFAAVGLLFAPSAAHAQEADEALPDLAPREFEIRGALQIQFPSLERQPLVGFNPPPRLLRLPQGRVPYLGVYKQATVDLPPGPLPAATPPPFRSLAQRPPLRGSATFTAGSYFARTARVELEQPLGAGSLRIDGSYEGLDGSTLEAGVSSPTGPRDAAQQYDRARLGAAISQRFVDVVTLEAGASGAYDRFTLFGLRTGASLGYSSPDRTFAHGEAHASARFDGDVPARLEVRTGYATLETDQIEIEQDTRFEASEARASASGMAALPLGAVSLVVDGYGSAAQVEGGDFADNLVYWGGAALDFASGTRLRARAGARLLGYDAEETNATSGFFPARSALYVSPVLDLSYRLTPTFEVFATNTPSAGPSSLPEMYAEVPYLSDEPGHRPTLSLVDAEAGVATFVGGMHLRAFAAYLNAPSYRYYLAESGGAQRAFAGRILAQYGEAEVRAVGGSASVSIPDGLTASLTLRLQNGKLDDPDADIPHLSPFVADLRASLPFAGGQGLFQAGARFAGERPYDFVGGEVGAFGAADAAVSYRVTPGIALVVEASNLELGGLTYWRDYPQQGPLVTGGVRALW
jgi:hypothetical protein